MRVNRSATTILAADIVGYSKLIGRDEEATLAQFRTIMRRFVRPTVVKHHGRLFKFIGDAVLAEFESPQSAVLAAIQIQSDLTVFNASIPADQKIFFRMGCHWGDVTLEGEDVLGDTVNIAARLEGLAESGGLVISDTVRSSLEPIAQLTFEDMGVQSLKNIDSDIQCYAACFDPALFAVPGSGTTLQPYRGLSAFREEDSAVFFGREVFVDLLEKAVDETSLVAIIGSSGSGKSSVVAAGLLPRMRDRNWLIAQFRPGSQPFAELANALQPLLLPDVSQTALRSAASSLADTLMRGEMKLVDISKSLRRAYPEAEGLLLIADQFEEFLTLCTDRLQRELFQDLIISGQSAIQVAQQQQDDVLPLNIVTTLRADFMGRFLQYRPLADAMQNGDIKLGPMTREELRETIENPARSQGVSFAPGLVERILDDVGDEPGNLPLLQFALTALWEKDAELGAELSHQAYEEIGRVQGALAYHAEDVLGTLQPAEQELAKDVFVQLVQPGDGVASTRRVATRAELGDNGWQLVQRLADTRLVITGRNSAGEETAEVVHEALIRDWDRFKNWLREDFEFRSWQEQLRAAMSQWLANEQDRGGLLRGAPLAQALDWNTSHGTRLNDAERDYIQLGQQLLQEQEESDKQQLQRELDLRHSRQNERRFKWFTASLAAIALITVATAVYALQQQRIAVDARKLAETERGIAQQERDRADTALQTAELARVDAETARATVEAAKAEVDTLNRQILSQQLAAESVLANDSPADRAAGLPLLLGMESVKATLESDQHSLLVANNALRQAVRTAPDHPWRRLQGHDGKVQAMQFSDSGQQLVTGGNDRNAILWDVQSNTLLHTLKGHQQRVTQARFVANDTQLITTSMDGTMKLWNTDTGQLLQTFTDHDGAIFDLSVSPDGTRWSTISYDGTAHIIDAASGKTLHELQVQAEPLYTSAFSPDGSRFATAGDLSASLWDANSGELINRLDTKVTAIRALEFSQDGRLLIVRGEDAHIDIRDALTGERHYRLDGHDGSVIWSATFSADSQHLLTAGGDGTVRIWQADTGDAVKTLIGRGGAISNAVYAPDSSLIASAEANGAAILWDTETGKVIRTMEGHRSAVSSILFSEDGNWLATAGEDGAASIWRIEDLITPPSADGFSLRGHDGGGQSVAFNRASNRAATAGYDGSIMLWDATDGSLLAREQSEKGVYYVAFSPDGSTLITAGGTGSVDLRSAEDLQITHSETVFSSASLWADFSNSGEHILATSIDATAAILDARTGRVIHRLEGHDGALFWSGFSPDGKLAATASYADNTVRLWDVSSGRNIHVLKGHSGGIYRCSFSPDGKYLVTASNDTTAKVWDTKTGDLRFSLEGHSSTVRAATFSPDNRYIVTGSYDNTSKVWSADNGELLRTLSGHQANIMTVTFGPDPSWFLTTSYDTTARIWNVETGEALHTLEGHTDKLEAGTISQDGRLVLTQGHDATPRLWRTQVEDLLASAAGRLPRSQPYFSTAELRRFRLGNLLTQREAAEAHIADARAAVDKGEWQMAVEFFHQALAIDSTALIATRGPASIAALIARMDTELSANTTSDELDSTVMEKLAELTAHFNPQASGDI